MVVERTGVTAHNLRIGLHAEVQSGQTQVSHVQTYSVRHNHRAGQSFGDVQACIGTQEDASVEVTAFLCARTKPKDGRGHIQAHEVVAVELLEELICLTLVERRDGLTVLGVDEVAHRQGIVSCPQTGVSQRREYDVSAADRHQGGVELTAHRCILQEVQGVHLLRRKTHARKEGNRY